MATTITWNGTSGNWSTAGSSSIWTGGKVPSATDVVDIKNTAIGTITLTSTASVGSILFASGTEATLEIADTGTLSVGAITMSGADTLTIASGVSSPSGSLLAGELNMTGVLTVGGSSTVSLAGGVLDTTKTIALDAGSTITGYGTITVGTSITGSGSIEAGSTGAASTLVLNVPTDIAAGIAVSILGSSTLEFTGTSDSTAVESSSGINIGTGTLLLAHGAVLTLAGAETTTGGEILLQGGNLTDAKGVKLGGSLAGAGVVAAGSAASGLFSGGSVTAEVESSNGTVYSALTFVDAVDASGATATSFTIDAGADLIFDKTVGSSTGPDGTVTFASNSGTLDISATANGFYDTIAGFKAGDEIIVHDPVAGGKSATETMSVAGDVVTIKDGATTEAVLTFTSSAQAMAVLDATTGASGTATVGTFTGGVVTTEAICFMAGTMIRSPGGEAAVETIKPGDLVVTADGRTVPVSWLGIQTISLRFADPVRTLPIRIKAGALGEGIPSRDLLLSPDHAVLVDGALIHAGALVNGTSITRETDVPQVFTYYHVEVDDHALILAENTPAETFVDNVDRLNFDNWAEHQALYPEGKEINELPYPRAKSHRQVPVNIRVMLADRALTIGAFPEKSAAA